MSAKPKIFNKNKKVEVRHTTTSALRILIANPLKKKLEDKHHSPSNPFKVHYTKDTRKVKFNESLLHPPKNNTNEAPKRTQNTLRTKLPVQKKRRSLSAQYHENKLKREKSAQNLNLTQSMEDLQNLDISAIEEERTVIKRRSSIYRSPISVSGRTLFADRSSTPILTANEMGRKLINWYRKHKNSDGFNNFSLTNLSMNIYGGSIEFGVEALKDLHRVIIEGYPIDECQDWLYLIKEHYRNIENEANFWICRAAIEEMRSNISQALEYYQNAIIHGAEVKLIDQAIDQLLQKWGIFDTSNLDKTKTKVVQESRNCLITSVIKLAIKERKFKNTDQISETPVTGTRNKRLSRSRYFRSPK